MAQETCPGLFEITPTGEHLESFSNCFETAPLPPASPVTQAATNRRTAAESWAEREDTCRWDHVDLPKLPENGLQARTSEHPPRFHSPSNQAGRPQAPV